eukprot:5480097-Pleurochrysis_carterae.AAC.3
MRSTSSIIPLASSNFAAVIQICTHARLNQQNRRMPMDRQPIALAIACDPTPLESSPRVAVVKYPVRTAQFRTRSASLAGRAGRARASTCGSVGMVSRAFCDRRPNHSLKHREANGRCVAESGHGRRRRRDTPPIGVRRRRAQVAWSRGPTTQRRGRSARRQRAFQTGLKLYMQAWRTQRGVARLTFQAARERATCRLSGGHT